MAVFCWLLVSSCRLQTHIVMPTMAALIISRILTTIMTNHVISMPNTVLAVSPVKVIKIPEKICIKYHKILDYYENIFCYKIQYTVGQNGQIFGKTLNKINLKFAYSELNI